MKKAITLAFALILALSFAACGDKGDGFGDITLPGGSSSTGAADTSGESTSTPEQTESKTQPPTGNIDAKLIGSWNFSRFSSVETYSCWYIFYADGTFKYSTTFNTRSYYGEYSASGGKINFSNVWWFELKYDGISETEHEKRSDVTFDYDFGTNSDGEYLLIFALERQGMDETYWDLTGAYEYLKSD